MGLKWWLGLPLFDLAEGTVCPGCTAAVGEHGDHLVCCVRNNYSRRHNAVQEALGGLLQEAGQGWGKEVPLPDPLDAAIRPADMLIKCWTEGKDTAVDLTLSHGWQVAERSDGPAGRERWRSFLRKKERKKHERYDACCLRAGWGFQAMAFGTWGGLGPEAGKVLHRITQRAAGWQEGDLRSSLQEQGRQVVAVALTRQVWRLLDGKNLL